VQFSRHSAQLVLFHVTRIVVAVMLVLALLSGIAPLKSISFASASLCSMSCCVALPPHRPGECDSVVSCQVKLPGHDARAHDAPDADHQHHTAATSHPDGDEHARQHESNPQPRAAHHAAHTAHAGTHHAETPEAPETSQADARQPESKSPEAKPESKQARRPGIAPASVSNPCPSDCGMAAGSFGNRVRSRDAATLAHAHRPRRPTTRTVSTRHVSLLPLTSTDKHRLAPPRAPPFFPALESPTT
jgi:hypothetical protein